MKDKFGQELERIASESTLRMESHVAELRKRLFLEMQMAIRNGIFLSVCLSTIAVLILSTFCCRRSSVPVQPAQTTSPKIDLLVDDQPPIHGIKKEESD